MAYIVAADLIVAFGSAEVVQIGRAVQTAATYDEARVSQAIASASAEADSFICGKYAVPCQMPPEYLTDSTSGGLTDSTGALLWSDGAARTPEVLRQIVLDIARFRLWDNRASEEVVRRYENALRWLRDVAAGRAGIMGPDGVQMPAPDAGNIPDVLGNKPAAVVAYAGRFGESFEKTFSFGGGW
jgi:phage gp36-like protein